MKCISLIQPWASLVLFGEKRIETRNWSTTHRGPLLFHALKGMPPQRGKLPKIEPFKYVLAAETTAHQDLPLSWPKQGPGKETPTSPGWTTPVKPQLTVPHNQINVPLTEAM
jgi:hypothetical protein